MVFGLSAALGAAVVFGYAAIFQARAVRRVEATDPTPEESTRTSLTFLGHLLRQPMFFLAIALSLVGFGLHLVAIRTIPLYLAQAGIAGSLAVTALLAVVLMGERLTTGDWCAVAAITVGLALLAIASGDIGDNDPPKGFMLALYVGIALVAVAGLFTARSHNAYAASALGVLAGLGFAGSGLAARVLPGL